MLESGRTEVKKDILGEEYLQHYDNEGRKSGKSVLKTDVMGDKYIQHYDRDGNNVGRSIYKETWLGEQYVQHVGTEFEDLGRSVQKETILGDRYIEHQDSKRNVRGKSTTKSTILGDKYTQHEGTAYPPVQRQASSHSESSTPEWLLYLIGGAIGIFFILKLAHAYLYTLLAIFPLFGMIMWYWRKNRKWLIASFSVVFTLLFTESKLGLYLFFLAPIAPFWGQFKLGYLNLIIMVAGGYYVFEPILAKRYPYVENGRLLERPKERKIALIAAWVVLTALIVYLPFNLNLTQYFL